MTKVQLAALQRYVSAVAWFMTQHANGDGGIRELLDSKAALEAAFGQSLDPPYVSGTLEQQPKSAFPDIL